jgi:uncharacterized integral membrane protein
MKILSGIFGILLLILVLCFALSNQTEVDVALWPLDGTLHMPLYATSLIPLLFGLILGTALGWISSVPHRLRARRLNKELFALNDKIGDLQKASLVQQVQTTTKRPFWERKG